MRGDSLANWEIPDLDSEKSIQRYTEDKSILQRGWWWKIYKSEKTLDIKLFPSIEEHIKKNNKSHIFKHLHSTTTCFDSYNSLCFKIIDKVNSKLDLKIKEDLHINWRKPDLNAQQNNLALTLLL